MNHDEGGLFLGDEYHDERIFIKPSYQNLILEKERNI